MKKILQEQPKPYNDKYYLRAGKIYEVTNIFWTKGLRPKLVVHSKCVHHTPHSREGKKFIQDVVRKESAEVKVGSSS